MCILSIIFPIALLNNLCVWCYDNNDRVTLQLYIYELIELLDSLKKSYMNKIVNPLSSYNVTFFYNLWSMLLFIDIDCCQWWTPLFCDFFVNYLVLFCIIFVAILYLIVQVVFNHFCHDCFNIINKTKLANTADGETGKASPTPHPVSNSKYLIER